MQRTTHAASRGVILCGALMMSAARADVVVIVSAKGNIQTMTSQEITEIFLGKSASMKPVDNGEKSPIREQFYTKVTGKDESQVKAIWAKLLFTGKAAPPKRLGSDAEVVKTVAADSTAIGYVDRGAVDSSVKIVFQP